MTIFKELANSSHETCENNNAKQLSSAVASLLPFGERLIHTHNKTEMILFEGTANDGVVSIQVQKGDAFQQLIVRGVIADVGYEVHFQDDQSGDKEYSLPHVESFCKTKLDRQHLDFAYNKPDVPWSFPNIPAPFSDIIELVNLLKRTEPSKERLKIVVDQIDREGIYRRIGSSPNPKNKFLKFLLQFSK
jgi:hypothetical protein